MMIAIQNDKAPMALLDPAATSKVIDRPGQLPAAQDRGAALQRANDVGKRTPSPDSQKLTVSGAFDVQTEGIVRSIPPGFRPTS